MNKLRSFATIGILAAVILLPYWLYLPLLGAALIFFPVYWEGIILALFVDVLYGGGIGPVSSLFSPMAFGATVILIIMLPVRERLRIYA